MTVTPKTYLFEHTANMGGHTVDGITAMIAVVDHAIDTTDALKKARAVTLANTAGRAVPVGYFDTLKLLNAAPVASEFWIAVGDNTVLGRFQTDETIATVASGVEQETAVND
jgi:hypothetical protein